VTKQQKFYRTIVPLSVARHGDWCVRVGGEFGFSSGVNWVPLTSAEFTQAAAEYVIVFASGREAVTPVIVLGLQANENLYLGDVNTWTAQYVPAFVRRYPFILSSGNDGKTLRLCIDEDFVGFNRENHGERLFDREGKPTQFIQHVLAFLREYQVQFRRTRAFCTKLKALDLLEPMRAEMTLHSGKQVSLTGFMAVSRERLNALAPEVLAELMKSDELELVYLHLQSMRNLADLKDRVPTTVAHTPKSGALVAAANEGTLGRGTDESTSRLMPVTAHSSSQAQSDNVSSRRRTVRAPSGTTAEGATYDAKFIFEECGFDWIPPWIDRKLLFNASYDLATGEIKLYFLNAEKSTIFKVSGKTITKQYDAVRFDAPSARLSEFLGAAFDYSDLLLDTVEDDIYYVLMEDTSRPQYLKFLRALCAKFGVSEDRLIEVVNKINKHQVTSLRECYIRKAVSGVKVPFAGTNCKLYARPFLTGNSYELSRNALDFLTHFHGCSENELRPRIRYLWVASELLSDRVVITTQHHELVHQD
jgi:hypothetical protein